jgi:amino acid adenylation domain-containing protein
MNMPFLLHQLLTESAERNPSQTAVVGLGGSLTYEQLERLSNQIAHQLREGGVRAGDRVGLLLDKRVEGVAALLGIQKAGAAYVPVDPFSPPNRAAYILSNCGVRALVSASHKVSKLPAEFLNSQSLESVILVDDSPTAARPLLPAKLRVNSLDEVKAAQRDSHPDVPITDNYLAYILYTSGSTGEPKGVMISHLNSFTFVNWGCDTFKVRPEDHVSSHAPFHFDLSVFDLYCTLKAGATIHLVPYSAAAFPAELARWISKSEISIWYSVPSALIQLVEHGQLSQHNYDKLRTVLFAGEVFPIKYLRRLVEALPKPGYFNLYGPTETNVCTYYQVQPSDLEESRTQPVSIGKACANMEGFPINDKGEIAKLGEEGELYVRSGTVMKGYFGRPEDTAKAVVPNFLNLQYTDELYRTGDIVRPMADGNFEYVGRRDKMIKSRGYRIELGEIEAALYAHSDVLEAAVIAVPDEKIGARIKGYVVVQAGLNREDLEKFCSLRLPRYMMPEALEMRTELPKTSTGKIDKKTLEKENAIA